MANMAAVLKETPSGFSLLNGYVIQYDTLRLVSSSAAAAAAILIINNYNLFSSSFSSSFSFPASCKHLRVLHLDNKAILILI